MKKNTKLMKIFKTLYDRNLKLNAREISELSGVEINSIHAYMIRLSNHTKKEKVDGRVYYWIPEWERDYVRKMIKTAT